VFDVDIQDGAPTLKLPYNANGTCASSPILWALYSFEHRAYPNQRILMRLHSDSSPGMTCASYMDQVSDSLQKKHEWSGSRAGEFRIHTLVSFSSHECTVMRRIYGASKGASRYKATQNAPVEDPLYPVTPSHGASRYQPSSVATPTPKLLLEQWLRQIPATHQPADRGTRLPCHHHPLHSPASRNAWTPVVIPVVSNLKHLAFE